MTIHVDIVSAEADIFSGLAEMVFAPAILGEVGITPRHAPLLTPLKPGEVRVRLNPEREESFYISGGLLEIQPHVVTVLADTALRAHDLDEASALEAKQRAEKIKYSYKIEGNQLILDNYLLTEVANKFRNQSVELYLYLPKGTLIKVDETVQNFDESDDDFFNLHYSSGDYIYKVGNDKVKCLNCPADENDHNNIDIDTEDINEIEDDNINDIDSVKTVSVKVNGKEVIRTETKSKTNKSQPRLTIDENGIIIKTK